MTKKLLIANALLWATAILITSVGPGFVSDPGKTGYRLINAICLFILAGVSFSLVLTAAKGDKK